MEGHIFANFLSSPELEPPFMALVVSGGHTALVDVRGYNHFKMMGQTRDDAAGEAFDKIARVMGLPYPGGPRIDALAKEGNPLAIDFPQALTEKGNFEFSFSGLKTAVAVHVTKHGVPKAGAGLEDLAASVQKTIVDTLVRKLMTAVRKEGVSHAVISGGVAANRGLRAAALDACTRAGVTLHVPPARSCTDNAAMIACAGALAWANGRRDGLELNARATWPVEEAFKNA